MPNQSTDHARALTLCSTRLYERLGEEVPAVVEPLTDRDPAPVLASDESLREFRVLVEGYRAVETERRLLFGRERKR